MATAEDKYKPEPKNADEFVARVKKDVLTRFLACKRDTLEMYGLLTDEVEQALQKAAHVSFMNCLQPGVTQWTKAQMEEAIFTNNAGKDDLLSDASIAWHNQHA